MYIARKRKQCQKCTFLRLKTHCAKQSNGVVRKTRLSILMQRPQQSTFRFFPDVGINSDSFLSLVRSCLCIFFFCKKKKKEICLKLCPFCKGSDDRIDGRLYIRYPLLSDPYKGKKDICTFSFCSELTTQEFTLLEIQ